MTFDIAQQLKRHSHINPLSAVCLHCGSVNPLCGAVPYVQQWCTIAQRM